MIQYNPRNWRVLAEGSASQQRAFEVISARRIFEVLKPFDPAHVGTIANDIDTPESDIDIICCAENFSELETLLKQEYGSLEGFSCRIEDALVATIPGDILIEIYAHPIPTEKQVAFRHFINACRVLDIMGPEGHEQIRALKLQGLKTEPAFAQVLGLAGDPYQTFLKIEEMSDLAIGLLINSPKH